MKLGRYEVVRELGKGAMGIVYLAKDPLIGRLVALKSIRPAAHADEDETKEFQQRFIREAQAAGILNHPNIVTVHDIGHDEATGVSFIAMEYVEGRNLKEALSQGRPLNFDQISDIIGQVAEALDFAHSKGIIHRDVKPANIILLDGPRAKITDFGIAKIASGANLTSTGQFLGTPNYMAPEMIKGTPVDNRADIFSLGICLYECLTRRKPFAGDSLTSISYKIVHEPYPSLFQIDPEIPPAFDEIVAHCLAKDPSKRYQRAKQVAEALRASARGEHHQNPESAQQTRSKSSIGDGDLTPDGREELGRAQLASHSYGEAVKELALAAHLDPSREARIRSELGFLFDLVAPATSGDRSARSRLHWCTNVWRVLIKDIFDDDIGATFFTRESETSVVAPRRVDSRDTRKPPQAKGEALEEAALVLFRRFFALAECDESQIRMQLQKLRKQRSGAQFGYDIAFEAAVAGQENVRCHVECKNYASSIALKDVADKLLQQKSHGVAIDHWILISPRADPAQDLHHFLEYESRALDFPFDIHVWSPESGVDQFFALEPKLYDRFYVQDESSQHPSIWSDDQRAAVVDRYRRLLRPVYRLPSGWKDYVDHERHLCFSDAEQLDFESTYRRYVPLGVKDQNGVELPGTAAERLHEWLAEPSQPIAFVLGEFGDGKSFLTYSLSRELLRAFRSQPDSGFIPIRLALREFDPARQPVRQFLHARLELFGADPAGWAYLKKRYRTLVILDGFDEISKELDSQTLTNNIRALIDCCDASIFEGCKILITSRTHFFETGDASRLLERLRMPLLLQLKRIPRGQVLSYLHEAAQGAEEHHLLQRLSQMHDPIGLGTKPLFLQMLKETLHELPVDLDEVSVYESYAQRSLERKIGMLDDREVLSARGESIHNLMGVLEFIAEQLQCAKEPYVSLKDLQLVTGSFAELLWRLAGDERLENDAKARIGTRSLLSRVKALEGDGAWLVDFCHRSIREYFVARRLCGSLQQGAAAASDFLRRVPVNHEILSFTAGIFRRSQDPRMLDNLRALIVTFTTDQDEHGLAGKALTILLRVLPVLPPDLDFRHRNFAFANLEDSNLSGLDFSGSSFRGANFANTNLERANLSYCDLTDAHLSETTSVLAVAALSADQVFAAYEDGTIWEWNMGNGGKPTIRVVYSKHGLKLSRLGVTTDGVPWGIVDREGLLFDRSSSEWRCMSRIRLHQRCADFHADSRNITLLVTGSDTRCLAVDLAGQTLSVQAFLMESSAFVSPRSGVLCFRSSEARVSLVGSGLTCEIATGNATSLDAISGPSGEILVAVGEADGLLRVFAVTLDMVPAEVKPILVRKAHSGPILSVTFCDSETVASGGLDRTVSLTPLHGPDSVKRTLQLSLRCAGLNTTGLMPESQRKRLDELKTRSSH